MTADRVVVDPTRMGGLPTIRGTRVTVGMILGQLAAGRSSDDVLAALEYAAAAVNEREVPVARPV